jgi:hypothetical protein
LSGQAEPLTQIAIDVGERFHAPRGFIRDAAPDRGEIFIALVERIESVVEYLGGSLIESERQLRLNPLVDIGRQLVGHLSVLQPLAAR